MTSTAMTVDFLDAEQAIERGLLGPDVYYDPRYGRSAALVDGGEWECAATPDGTYWYPYVCRRVPGVEDAYDIVSPYGYGGLCGPKGPGLVAFRAAFLEQSRARGLVAEFLRTNPLDVPAEELSDLGVDRHRSHRTYAIEWSEDPEEYFRAAQGRHRTAVRRAAKEGLVVQERPLAAIVEPDEPFRRLYDATMHRVGASRRLRLGDRYFELFCAVGDEHAQVLQVARPDGEVVAAAIFLTWGARVHYHLSGASIEGQRLGATNLLIDHAARTLLRPGGWLHLGGGIIADDGLDTFKRSMATTTTATLLCQTVVDRPRYAELCQRAGVGDTEYFPAYRAAL